MHLSTQINPISYLKSHTAPIVTELTQSRQPLVLKELRSYILKNFPLQTWQKTYGPLKEAIGKLATFSHLGAMWCLF